MEEEDETQSQQSPRDSPILPTNNVTVASAAAKPPPSSSSSQSPSALAVQTPSVTGGTRNGRGGGGGGGGRDDCWSEEATKVLIEAWGDRFSEPGKGTLKQQQWHEVAEMVNESGECKYTKTDVQCKNRIDTVKKKYKQEKAKVASSGNGPSKWVFFKKLEALIGGVGVGKNKKAPVGGGSSSSGPMRWHFRKRSASETDSEPDSPPESLPPSPKRVKMDESDVAKAILGFTEAYEKAETGKIKLMMELEKERMKFAKEMELQRMQFFKTQMEITQNNQEEERSKPRINDDRNVKNNGDVSS